MMGEKERAFAAHHAVCLEELVPAGHFYRQLEGTLDLAFVRDLVRGCYASGGRPSVDPVVFFKLQLILFFEGLRSERQLMAVVADRLSLRWYLGYDLGERVPDHSSLTKIRERYGVEVFRRFFDAVVERCRAAGLVWGQELYLDATQVDADAALGSVAPRFAVEAHLDRLFSEEAAGDEVPVTSPGDAPPPEDLPVRLPVTLPAEAEAALAATNVARHDWLAETGRQQRDRTHGDYRRRADFQVSTTDADATVMRRKGGGSHLGYHAHYVVDGGKARIILRVLTTPAEVMENQPALDLIWQTCFRWHLRPRQATGDTTYGTLDNIVALEEAGIRAFVPLADPDKKTALFGKGRFTYQPGRDAYLCPQGHELALEQTVATQRYATYRAPAVACAPCPLRAACTTSPEGRTIRRNFDEGYAERVQAYAATPAYQKALRKRSVWVEPLFAEAKQWHGLGRCRLRGLERVNGEVLLTAGGQNLKRLLAARGWGRRPFPAGPAQSGTLPLPAAPDDHRRTHPRHTRQSRRHLRAYGLTRHSPASTHHRD